MLRLRTPLLVMCNVVWSQAASQAESLERLSCGEVLLAAYLRIHFRPRPLQPSRDEHS
jgi:hypothetical protein